MLLPAAYCLKAQFPDIQVHFLSNSSNAASDIMRHSPYIDKIIDFKFKGNEFTLNEYFLFFLIRYIPLLLKIKKEKYHYVFSINPNFLIKAILCFFSKKNKIIRANRFINQIENGMKLLEKVGNAKKVILQNTDLLIFENEDKVLEKYSLRKGEYILFSFYCTTSKRSFLNYHNIIATLKEKSMGVHTFVLIGKTGSHTPNLDCLDLINKTTIQEVAILIKNAKLLVAVDGGLMHIGMIQNVPIIAIFSTIHSQYRCPINKSYVYFKAIDKKREGGEATDSLNPRVFKNNYESDDLNLSSAIIEETLVYLNYKSNCSIV